MIEAVANPADFDSTQWLRDLDGALSGCEDMASLSEVQVNVMVPAKSQVFPPDWDAAKKLIAKHLARVQQTILDGG